MNTTAINLNKKTVDVGIWFWLTSFLLIYSIQFSYLLVLVIIIQWNFCNSHSLNLICCFKIVDFTFKIKTGRLKRSQFSIYFHNLLYFQFYFCLVKLIKMVYFLYLDFNWIFWFMKSPKNFEKITVLKIWELVFFWGVKTHFGAKYWSKSWLLNMLLSQKLVKIPSRYNTDYI